MISKLMLSEVQGLWTANYYRAVPAGENRGL